MRKLYIFLIEFAYTITVCISLRPIVSSWGEGGPKKRVKMIGMGYYHPGALAPLNSLDNNKDMSYFPFRSPSNIFCIGDRVILSAAAIRMDKFFKEVLKQVKNVEKVLQEICARYVAFS